MATPLLASSSSLGRPIGAPHVFLTRNYLFLFNFSLVFSYLLHCTRLCPIVIFVLSPPPFRFDSFRLCYVSR